jgi:hypothetical protein
MLEYTNYSLLTGTGGASAQIRRFRRTWQLSWARKDRGLVSEVCKAHSSNVGRYKLQRRDVIQPISDIVTLHNNSSLML